MLAERPDRVIGARKLGFRQRGVDLVVANLVQQDGRSALAAPELGDKVMLALPDMPGDGPAAEGTNGVIAHGG